mgnify:CR=1 FL=1
MTDEDTLVTTLLIVSSGLANLVSPPMKSFAGEVQGRVMEVLRSSYLSLLWRCFRNTSKEILRPIVPPLVNIGPVTRENPREENEG